MNNLDLFRAESGCALAGNATAVCPVHTGPQRRRALNADDELVFPNHRRAFSHYSTSENGVTQLNIYYGDNDLVFEGRGGGAGGGRRGRAGRGRAGAAGRGGGGGGGPRGGGRGGRRGEEGGGRRAAD